MKTITLYYKLLHKKNRMAIINELRAFKRQNKEKIAKVKK